MRTFAALAASMVALLVGPAVADAHHLDQDTSTIDCVLVNNAPVVAGTANYAGFTAGNFPVSWNVKIDGTIAPAPAGQGQLNWGSGSYAHTFSIPTTPGAHQVQYNASWPGGYGGYPDTPKTVVCPPPVLPPVLCNGVPVAPGTNCAPPPAVTVVYCGKRQMPPGTVPGACGHKPPPVCKCSPPPACVPSHYRYRVTVTPRHINHGQVTFRLIGPHARHIRWYVDHHRHGLRGHAWEHVSHHGRRWSVYLWVPQVWTSRMWGHHKITVTFDTPCGHRKFSRSYFNHDPISPAAQRELAQAFHQ